MDPERPALRNIEPLPFRDDGQDLILLRDPAQIGDQILVVRPHILPLLTLIDGSRTPTQIVEAVDAPSVGNFTIADLEQVLKRLDEACFLDNDRYRERKQRLISEFRAERLRQAFHSGVSYPDAAAELVEVLASHYTDARGAGLPRPETRKPAPAALIAPHIDLRLGGPSYTHAYRELAESDRPDLFIILGTGHNGLPELFSISEKDFVTPLGTASVDAVFARRLREHLGAGLFLEDLTHRTEHTIEFQVLYLQHLYGVDLKILPVLTSFSYLNFVESSLAQSSERLLWTFIEAVRKTIDMTGQSVTFIASVDLAHVGPRYGDPGRPAEDDVRQVLEDDRQMLSLIEDGDPKEFFSFVLEEQDRRRICGFSPLLTLLSLLEGRQAEIRTHTHAEMDENGSIVSFAAGVVR